jgi:ADP-ribose pyrophosphatase
MRYDRIAKKEYIDHSNSVGIIAVDCQGKILLIKQYRFPVKKNLIEIPAGKIERGETPERAALRELNEETGHVGTLIPLTRYYLAPGYSTEKMSLFLAINLKKIKSRLPKDHDEIIKVNRMNLKAAIHKCINGEIEDSKTISAVMYYYHCNFVLPVRD